MGWIFVRLLISVSCWSMVAILVFLMV
jgi:hypothetical protein